ncbi:paraquat-inducible protein A [Bordetella genomosp. 11]|uniref:Paraquat-inducible membrane protein A n=1 Tax=Bordetella genomosp. 11 TaxID=1416808 RepID=A0A261UH46_9BORD|nr:PqiA/YebS family transporter subunit [Bordetella genomosp. 11]OZI61268.1 paraquat-inducible membrane protein A [Bordetella genomosp. 11]
MASTSPLISCEHCGTIYRRQELRPGEQASCSRCGSVLWRYSGLHPSGWLALALAALIVFIIANAYPVAIMRVQGMVQAASLPEAVLVTWRQGHEVVAVMTGLAGLVLPLLQLVLLVWVLYPLSTGARPPAFASSTRMLRLLAPWSMVPVFVLGVLVAVVKLAGMASVSPGVGLAGFALLTILLTTLGRLSSQSLWHYAERAGAVDLHIPHTRPGDALAGCHVCGQVQALPRAHPDSPHRCVRCDSPLHLRKPDHLARTWALLIAAAILYIPANVLPVMNIESIFGDSGHTILGGVIELWQTGSWDIALIVFVASVMVPLTKLLALAVLAWKVQRGSATGLRQRTRLYGMVEFIGQWSMLDVFVVILLAALAHFQGLMTISAGAGAGAFGTVVILTMLAAMSFDPRYGWDMAADEADHATPLSPRVAHPAANPPSAMQALGNAIHKQEE